MEFIIESDSVIHSPEFKEWFGDSIMCDTNGIPVMFYHGTNDKFDKFDDKKIGLSTDPGWLGRGFYFYTNEFDASQYGVVGAYFLKIENPYIATDEDNEFLANENSNEASSQFTNDLINDGYDGVYYDGNLRGETVVFNTEQIWKVF